MNTASTPPAPIALAALIVSIAAAGCASPAKAPESTGLGTVRMAESPELATAVEDFREARYQAAFDRARSLARTTTPPLREQAAWVAGLSAYQMQMLDEAELQFMAAARSDDPKLVTDTKIMTADIRVLQKRWGDAARLYREAAQSLSGTERSHVLDLAGAAEANAPGRPDAVASARGGSGGTAATSPTSGAPAAASASAPTAFALQAGAYQNEKNARRRATDIASSTRSAGLGEPRVIRTKDGNGRQFWTVQVGSFASRQSAESARSKVSSLDLIIAASG